MKLPGAALRAYGYDARDAFVHAPVEVLMGVTLAVTFSVAIRQTGGEDWWMRVLAAAVLALPLVFGASVLRARGVLSPAARWGATGLALVLAGAYAAFLFDADRSAEGWRAASLAAAAWLALALVPALGGGDERARRWRIWRFDALLLQRMVAVGLYGAALFAALAGAVSAVRSLFELSTPEHLYQDIAGAVFFALVPWVVAGGVPALAAEGAAAPAPTLVTVRRAGRYLYAVVLIVYLAILYAYTAKVIVTGELPKNLVSPIVLFAGLAGFLGGIFLEPLQEDGESRGVARLVRSFPALLLPLLPLPIWAVAVRQGQYGWTEFRYLRLLLLGVLAVLAVWGTARLLRRGRPLLAGVPAVLAAALLLGSVGPWSAQSVSRRDQTARLREALTGAGLMRAGRLARPPLAPGTRSANPTTLATGPYRAVTGALYYLYEAHGHAAVSRALGTEFGAYGSGGDAVSALAIREGCRVDAVRMYAANLPAGTPIPTSGGTMYFVDSNLRPVGPTVAPEVKLRGTDAAITIPGRGAWTGRAALRSVVRLIPTRTEGSCDEGIAPAVLAPADARVPFVDSAGRPRGELVVTSVSYGNTARSVAHSVPGPMTVEHLSGVVFVRE